jgi:RNA polymerase sigma-70 factor (sigma-E family)
MRLGVKEVGVDDFEAFVRDTGPSMSRFAYLLCGDRHHGEDLMQLALWKAHRAWARVRVADDPNAYFRTILLREYLSWRRRRWTSEVAAPGELLEPAGGSVTSRLADRVAETDAVRRMLATLPRKQRAVLVMRYFLDLPESQIAAELGCSGSTVRSTAARALAVLRDTAAALPEVSHELD